MTTAIKAKFNKSDRTKLTLRANRYGHAVGLTLIKEQLGFKNYLLGFLK